ncbi:MAG: HD domain-containing protein [Candidatus Thorarchaeota archaeon]|nr:HD domain-containing protein [Candidatus Thorarchaeota archaeon]
MTESEKLLDAYVRGIFAGYKKGAHTYDHTLRVYMMSLQIGNELDANLRVLGAAALLHDIGRVRETETGISHSILSGQMARPALRQAGYSEEEITQIIEAIRTHRFSEGLTPTTLEGHILSDADKLDAMGAVGVYRAIAQSVRDGRDMEGFLHHADEKLLKLANLIHTQPAKRMAHQRHQILQSFVEQLREEISLEEGLTSQ